MFCTYISTHPCGKFYIGKGRTKAVEAGHYKGSGTLFGCYLKKYHISQWACRIIKTFDSSEEAYSHEAELVTLDTLKDPNCLNMIPGGLANRTVIDSTRKKLSLKASGVKQSKETIALRVSKNLGQKRTKDTKNKMSEWQKGVSKGPNKASSLVKTGKAQSKLHSMQIQTTNAIKYGRASPFNQVTGGL